MSDAHRRIADLEERIEALSERAERCRKLELAAKTLILAGLLLFFAPVFGLLRIGPAAWLVGMAAALGGTVLYGANRSTLAGLLAQIHEHRAERTELIDSISPRLVEAAPVRAQLS